MSVISDLTDFVTGGASGKAEGDLERILAQIQGIGTPSAEQLQLGPLQRYEMTGTLDPALAEAAQTGPSAFDSQDISTLPIEAMQRVLASKLALGEAGGLDPQARADIARAESEMGRNVAGQRGAIAADFAQRGVPASLISAALQNATVGENAQQGYENALSAEGAAAQRGQQALTDAAGIAGQTYALTAGQQNAAAAARDALASFNAANRQQTNLANAGATNTANAYNVGTEQGLENQNVSGENERRYNNQVQAPKDAASLALQKGSLLSGVGQAQAGQHMAAGQQAAGLFSGLLGAGATLGAGAMAPTPTTNIYAGVPTGRAHGGEIDEEEARPNIPATNFEDGGHVPGAAAVPGDHPANDTVTARLSPGEFVVPRTAMARPEVRDFLRREVPTPNPPSEAHPSDVASILKALALMRGGQEAFA